MRLKQFQCFISVLFHHVLFVLCVLLITVSIINLLLVTGVKNVHVDQMPFLITNEYTSRKKLSNNFSTLTD